MSDLATCLRVATAAATQVLSSPMTRRSWRGVAGVLGVSCGFVSAYFLYLSLQATKAQSPEETFQAVAKGGSFLLGMVAFGTLYAFARPPRAAQPPLPPRGDLDGVGVPGTLAIISCISGLLSWLPLLPLTRPLVYASVAVLGGLFGLRAMAHGVSIPRDRRLAVVGTILGAAYLCLYGAHEVFLREGGQP